MPPWDWKRSLALFLSVEERFPAMKSMVAFLAGNVFQLFLAGWVGRPGAGGAELVVQVSTFVMLFLCFSVLFLVSKVDALRRRVGLSVEYHAHEAGNDLYMVARDLVITAKKEIVIVNGYGESRRGNATSETAYFEAVEEWGSHPGRIVTRYVQVEHEPHGVKDLLLGEKLGRGYEESFLEHLARVVERRDAALAERLHGESRVFWSSKVRQSTFLIFDHKRLLWCIHEGDPSLSADEPSLALAGFFVIDDPHEELVPHFMASVRKIAEVGHRLERDDIALARGLKRPR